MFDFINQSLLFLVSLVFLLGVVVIIHELGHYFAGKLFGAAVESYSIGFGKPFFTRADRSGTFWEIRWIPLGGFVQFAQHPIKTYAPPSGKFFEELTVGQRAIIAVAGPVANFILAIFLFAALVLVNGEPRSQLVIESIEENSPAASAGFRDFDVIYAIDDKKVESYRDFMPKIQLGGGSERKVTVLRENREVDLYVTPERKLQDNGLGQQVKIGFIGVSFDYVGLPPKSHNPITAIGYGVGQTIDVVTLTGRTLGGIITGQESFLLLSGPIGIGDTTRRVVNTVVGAETISWTKRLTTLIIVLIELTALISIGIGLFNLLPLPILDGGHLLFYAYEAIRGKPLPQKVQELSLTFGFFLLMSLVVIITFGDILKTGLFG